MTSIPTTIILMKVIRNPFPITAWKLHMYLQGQHIFLESIPFYIFHNTSGYYTIIMQIHFYIFIGGEEEMGLKNTNHVIEKFSSHWLIFYTRAHTKKNLITTYWQEIQFMFIQAAFHNEDKLKPNDNNHKCPEDVNTVSLFSTLQLLTIM